MFVWLFGLIFAVPKAEVMELNSIDYARLIQYAAQKLHLTILNRTQVHKILFYVYGVYLADNDKRLFTDDRPKAWPYGPVFPRVNKWMQNQQEEVIRISPEMADRYSENMKALNLVVNAVNAMYDKTAIALTRWSHQEGSPWYRTLYKEQGKQAPWNTDIDDEVIKEYFKDPHNRISDVKES